MKKEVYSISNSTKHRVNKKKCNNKTCFLNRNIIIKTVLKTSIELALRKCFTPFEMNGLKKNCFRTDISANSYGNWSKSIYTVYDSMHGNASSSLLFHEEQVHISAFLLDCISGKAQIKL